jgi:hypothetical protein
LFPPLIVVVLCARNALLVQARLATEPIFKGAMMEAKKNGWIEVTKDKATGEIFSLMTSPF